VAADETVSPGATLAELETQKRLKLAAEVRWKSARERLAGHQLIHQSDKLLRRISGLKHLVHKVGVELWADDLLSLNAGAVTLH
jgi:hypothetical protein